MGRKEAREAAFIILYQTDIQKCEVSGVRECYYSEHTLSDKDKLYIDDVTNGVFANIEETDSVIAKGLKSWTLNRISKVDKAILRLAVYEIFHREDIPEAISIYEAVELVKKYDTEDAGGFVNGILRGIVRVLEEGNEG